MKVITIAGYHNSGKTILVEQLARKLLEKGYRVGYVKHDPKDHGVTDKENSDTHRLFKILPKVALSSPLKLTLWEKRDDDPLKLLKEYFSDCDVVLLEGYKSYKNIPKIVLGNLEAQEVLLRIDKTVDIDHIIKVIEEMEENL